LDDYNTYEIYHADQKVKTLYIKIDKLYDKLTLNTKVRAIFFFSRTKLDSLEDQKRPADRTLGNTAIDKHKGDVGILNPPPE